MPKAAKSTNTHHTSRTLPYPNVTTPVSTSSYPTTSMTTGSTPPPRSSGAVRTTTTASWSPENDDLLMRARQQGLNWRPIATTHFPDKSANACRKRHERLMERRNVSDSWNEVKIGTLAKAYNELREEMWRPLADRLGEKWQTVESKCMEKGLKTLQNAGRTATRRERNNTINSYQTDDVSDSYAPNERLSHSHSHRSRSHSHSNISDGFNDSAIGPDADHPFATRGRADDDQQQAPYSAGGLTNPSSSRSFTPNRTLSSSTASFSVTGFTPTITASPQFPLVQSPTTLASSHSHSQQTLPSFSAAFSGLPSVLASSLSNRHNPPSIAGVMRSPPVTTH